MSSLETPCTSESYGRFNEQLLDEVEQNIVICQWRIDHLCDTLTNHDMILAPFFGDQFYNANTMKQSGLAEVVNLWSMSSEEFVSLIQKVLSDSR